jgi:uncharacterized repeat protein (TIGR02059 family)
MNGALSVSGTEADATIEYSTNGTDWSSSFTPSEGSNTVYVRQTDVAGNVSSPSTAYTFTLDTQAPVFISAAISEGHVILRYTDSYDLDSNSIPTEDAFNVYVNGSVATVSSVIINPSERTVTLTFADPLSVGDFVTISYSDATENNDAHAIQDLAGNDSVSFSHYVVNTVSMDVKPPYLPDPTPREPSRGIHIPDGYYPIPGTSTIIEPARSVALSGSTLDDDLSSAIWTHQLLIVNNPDSHYILVEQYSTFSLTHGVFRHTDPNANMTYEASLSDGRPLPDWIQFDTASGRFFAKPPHGTEGSMDIKVTARDDKGHTAVVNFLLHVKEKKATRAADQENHEVHALDYIELDSNSGTHDYFELEGAILSGKDLTDVKTSALLEVKGCPSLAEQLARNSIRGNVDEIDMILSNIKTGIQEKQVSI